MGALGKDCDVIILLFGGFMPKGRIANTHDSFWKYFDRKGESECWLWKGTIHKSGYGTFCISKRLYQAHRAAYFYAYPGEIELLAPRDKSLKQFVLHKCDVRACVNPAHLFLGSVADNNLDMLSKNRAVYLHAEDHWASAFSNKQIKDVRNLLKEGCPQAHIAKKYGVSQACISNINLRKTYGSVV